MEIKVVGGFYGSGCSQLLLFLRRCLFVGTMFRVDVGVVYHLVSPVQSVCVLLIFYWNLCWLYARSDPILI